MSDEETTAGGVGSTSDGAPPRDRLPFPLLESDRQPAEDGGGGEDKKPRGTTPGKPAGKPAGSDSEPQDPKPKKPKKPKPKPKEEDGEEEDDKPDDDEPKPKPRGKRKVTRGGQEQEIDLDDEETLIRLLSDSPMHRVKINGEEHDVSLENVLRDYELRSASHKRMDMANDKQRRFESMVSNLRDPNTLREFIQNAGYDDPFAPLHSEFLRQLELQELAKTDPQKHAAIMHEEGVKAERQRQQAQRAEEERQRQHIQQQADAKRFGGGLRAALEGEGIDRNDPVVQDLLHRMYIRAQAESARTKQPMPEPSEFVYELKRRLDESFRARNPIPDDPEQLLELIGEDRLAALDKHRAKAAKADERRRARGEGGSGKPAPKNEDTQREKAEGRGEVSDYLRGLR